MIEEDVRSIGRVQNPAAPFVFKSFTSPLARNRLRGVPKMARYRQSAATKCPRISQKFQSTRSTGRSAPGQECQLSVEGVQQHRCQSLDDSLTEGSSGRSAGTDPGTHSPLCTRFR